MTAQETRRRAELAKIHVAKKELGLDANCYEALIQGVGGADSGSAKDLDAQGRSRVLDRLKELGFKEKAGITCGGGKKAPVVKYQDLDDREGMASGKQLRLIEVLWNEVSYQKNEVDKKCALRNFIKRMTKYGECPGIDDVKFMTSNQAHIIITAIKRMQGCGKITDEGPSQQTSPLPGGRGSKGKNMDSLALSLLIARIILVNTNNLVMAVEKAKQNDGKVSANELPEIIFETALKSLDDLGAGSIGSLGTLGNLNSLLKG